MKQLLITGFLFLSLSFNAFAQKGQISITGVVVDEKNETIIGANVLVKGTNNGAITNVDGRYTIQAPENGVLVFSYVGMQSHEEKINRRSQINITLRSTAESLSEVVVVGYGTQKKINLTGAVSTVREKELQDRPITQASQALQGLVSGVFVNSNSGEAGNDQADIVIRGIGSLNTSALPLVLIDGIEGSINDISSDDIENISVLKDAAAASIYGTRAANGVVLITTKRGQFEKKTTIGYRGYVGFSKPTVLPDMVTDNRTYLEMYKQAAENSGTPWTPRGILASDPEYDKLVEEIIDEYAAKPSTDYRDIAFKNKGTIQRHDVTISGGGKSNSYFVSLGYLFQDGWLKGNQEYKRYNIRTNLDTKLSSKMRLFTSISYINSNANLTPKDNSSDLSSSSGKGSTVFSGAAVFHPFVPAFTSTGQYAGPEQALGIYKNRPNLQGIIENETGISKRSTVLGSISFSYDITRDLVTKATIGLNQKNALDISTQKEYQSYDMVTNNPIGDSDSWRNKTSIINMTNTTTTDLTTDLQINYSKRVGKNEFKVLGGFSRRAWIRDRESVTETNFGSLDLVFLGNGAKSSSSGTINDNSRLHSFFGRLNYQYSDKYLFELNLREDASSRFGPNNRWGTFPSLSGGWIISNEKFWKIKFFNYLKIRGSWGLLGTEPSEKYGYLTQAGLGYNYGTSGGAISKIGNSSLKWEQTENINGGVNLGLFNNKLLLEADYFIKTTSDILVELDNPMVIGVTGQTTYNAASMENKGWEASITYRNKIGKVQFSLSGNITNVQNKILAIDPTLATGDDVIMKDRANNIWWRRGYPINHIYGFRFDGIFKTENEVDQANASGYQSDYLGKPTKRGDIKYFDYNGDGKISEEDQFVLGNRNPEWLYGFNFTVSYKGFELSGIIQGIGNTYANLARDTGPFPFAGLRRYWVNAWSEDNQNSNIPAVWIDRTSANGGTTNANSIEDAGKYNSFWMQNIRYCRLKNIQLSYDLPKKILKKTPASSARIYVNGQNLFTITPLIDFDPERNPLENNATATLPQSKIITTGINLTF